MATLRTSAAFELEIRKLKTQLFTMADPTYPFYIKKENRFDFSACARVTHAERVETARTHLKQLENGLRILKLSEALNA